VKVLVTGGAGYIGSHAVRDLRDAGHDITVLDDLSRGHRQSVPPEVPLVRGDLGDAASLARALAGTDAVIHFAGLLSVSESVADPASYYRTNVVKGLALLEAMQAAGVRDIVFSSTCAVYGIPVRVPIDEDHPKDPINPYGATKLAFERALDDLSRAGRLRAVALRYFNAAGCHPDGSLGEDHRPEDHLIPRAIDAALGRSEPLHIHGEDYDTPDGTCIRDYIHVQDLARAHVLALSLVSAGPAADRPAFQAFNLGTGVGRSVREVLRAVERSVRKPVPARVGPRRPGDPPRLVAAPERGRRILGFEAKHSALEGIVESAVRWRRDHPQGYGTAS
jgi:UDP-glucose-4-epimerase GalE